VIDAHDAVARYVTAQEYTDATPTPPSGKGMSDEEET